MIPRQKHDMKNPLSHKPCVKQMQVCLFHLGKDVPAEPGLEQTTKNILLREKNRGLCSRHLNSQDNRGERQRRFDVIQILPLPSSLSKNPYLFEHGISV